MTIYLKKYLAFYSGLNKKCWQGIFLNFLEQTIIGIYYFLPIYFVKELQLNLLTSGVILSCYGVGTIIGGFLGGKLSDQLSSGIVTQASLLLQGLVFFALIRFTSAPVLMIILFFMGIASYSFITANHLWVLSRCGENEEQKLKAINILNAVSNLGLSVSAIIISIAALNGFHRIFFISSIAVIFAAIYFFFVETPKESHFKNSVFHQVENISQKNSILPMLICLFLVGFIIFQSSMFSIYVQEKFPQYGMSSVGILFSLNTLMVVVLQTPLGHFLNNYNKFKVAGVGALLLGTSMSFLPVTNNFFIVTFIVIVNTLGEMLFFSVSQLICYQQGNDKSKGKNLGLYRMVYAGSRIVAPITGSFIFQHYGANQLWYVIGFIGIVCLLICFKNKTAMPMSSA